MASDRKAAGELLARLQHAMEVSTTDVATAMALLRRIRATARRQQNHEVAAAALRGLIVLYGASGQTKQEFRAAKALAAECPDSGWSWMSVGHTAAQLGRVGESIRAYERALSLAADDAELAELARRALAGDLPRG